jgi:diaminopimelate decarboxylase
MLAKPYLTIAARTGELNRASEQGRSEVGAIAGKAELTRDVLPIMERVATASLAAAGGIDRIDAERWLSAAASGLPIASPDSCYQEIERSVSVATGHARPGLVWALGHTWRALYPAIVARLGGDGLANDDWPAFLRLATELERVAFGPPAINAAKLLALVDARQVDLSHITSRVPQADVVVDAVLPGPGVPMESSTVAARLIADGHARLASCRRGFDVDRDGFCRSPDGRSVPGLAAIGRPTEDSVIGNDTLSRTLHPVSDRWARRVVERHRKTVAT